MKVYRLLASALPLCSIFAAACDASNPLDVSGSESPSVRGAKGVSSFAAPSTATAAATGTDRIAIVWQDNATTESSFEIQRSVSGGAYTLLASKPVNSEAHTDTGLNPSTGYCYRIRALRLTGNRTTSSTFSNAACANTAAAPPPIPPAPPAPANAVAIAFSALAFISWNAEGTNASDFRLERSTGPAGPWALVGITTNARWELGDYAPLVEQAMCYRVIAFNTGGSSPPSNTACVTPLADPTGVSAVRVTGGVELSWADNTSFEDGYTVALEYMSCCTGACEAFDPNYSYEVVAELPRNSTTFFFATGLPARACTLLHVIALGPNAESRAPPVSMP